MPWKDPTELVVAANGEIYTAAVGTTLPTSPTAALNAAFVGAGYATEDGVTLRVTPDVAEFRGWQSPHPLRREVTTRDAEVSFGLLQWSEQTVPLAFGGGVVTSVTGGYRYEIPDATSELEERSMVVEWADGSKNYRLVLARGNTVEAVETNLQRTATSVLPITFRALAPEDGSVAAYILTNDPAFAVGS